MRDQDHGGDLHIPSALSGPGAVRSSYRAHRPSRGRGTRILLLVAAGLGGLLAAGAAGWAFIGGHDAPVPVIEADRRPLRVKPDDAGGMQVAGAEDQVLGGQGGTARGMAPPAEAPAPQALRAQMPPSASPQGVPSPAPAAPSVSAAPPDPAASPTPPAVAQAAPVRPAAPARPAPAGNTVVQLAAVDTEQAAQAEWARLARRMPDLLGDRRPVVQRADRDGRAVWRVRTGGFSDIADATSFCSRVRSKGGACSIASF